MFVFLDRLILQYRLVIRNFKVWMFRVLFSVWLGSGG